MAMLQVCDRYGAGTDASLEMTICDGPSVHSNGVGGRCCSTGELDAPDEDDFERGDFRLYKRLGSCAAFSLAGDSVVVSVANRGADGVCFSRVALRTMSGEHLECSIPQEEEFWVDNGTLDLRCQRLML